MARPLRIEFPGAFYHVTARGNERKAIYRNDTDRHRFLAILGDVVDRFRLLLHAYVLMDNHYHLLVETLETNLARAMRALDGEHAKHFNRVHQRVGHLFQGRYKAILVDRGAYLIELSRYIHLNPVRAGIVMSAEQYRWSSARAYVGRRRAPAFLTVAEVLGHFGRTTQMAQRDYREFLREAEDRRCAESPLDKVVGQTLLGDQDWVREMRCRIEAWLSDGRPHFESSAEVPAVGQLRKRPTVEQVMDTVATAMRVDRRAMRERHSRIKARAVAMYLTDSLSGLPQREIAAVFGVGRFAVSKASAMIGRELERDRRLRQLVNRLRTALRAGPL